ncbi:hypothetical protein ACFL2Q_16095 [Thermodesulfobacteriota bacterium]
MRDCNRTKTLASMVIAVAIFMMFAPTVEAVTWKYYQNRLYRFYYYNTHGRNIAYKMSRSSAVGILPYTAAYRPLGKTGLNSSFWNKYGRIRVFLRPSSGYNRGYSYLGKYIKIGSTFGITNQYIVANGPTYSNWRSLTTYGALLAHESSHLFYTNYTQIWRKSWAWDASHINYRRSSLVTEALAYYTANCWYKYGPRYSYSTIKNQLGGYKQAWLYTADRYIQERETSKDWWQFHAIGYFVTRRNFSDHSTSFIRSARLMALIRYYVTKGSPSVSVFHDAFQTAWCRIYTDYTTYRDSQYLYYYYGRMFKIF